MTMFRLNDDEVALINAFRLLNGNQRVLLLAAVLGTATEQYAARVHTALDNVVPWRAPQCQ
jgi:hypothetical protein